MNAEPYTLVTGASSGLGTELAIGLARRARTPLILSGRSEARLAPVAERIAALPGAGPVVIVTADLATPDGPEALFEALAARGLNLVALYNNAGASAPGSVLKLPPRALMNEIILDFAAPAALSTHFLQHLRRRGAREGTLVQILSLAARFPGMPNFAHYNAAKKALDAFTRGIGYEARQAGLAVRIHRAFPGAITGTQIATRRIAEQNARAALPAARVAELILDGVARGDRVIVPGWINKLGYVFGPRLPQRLSDPVIHRLYDVDDGA